MNTRYALIDYENVQPNDLASLDGQPIRVIVFLGADQKTVATDVAIPLQALGARGQYVRVNSKRRNALDSHIAFYLGGLVREDSTASFHVISNDGGYDPLLEHLRQRGVDARRSGTLASLLPAADETVGDVMSYLKSAGKNRPRREQALRNAINARRRSTLAPLEIERVIAELVRRRVIAVTDGKVAYT